MYNQIKHKVNKEPSLHKHLNKVHKNKKEIIHSDNHN
jgi:hypothetical protein